MTHDSPELKEDEKETKRQRKLEAECIDKEMQRKMAKERRQREKLGK